MNPVKISDKELQDILAQVQSEVSSVLKAEKESVTKLSKAEESSSSGSTSMEKGSSPFEGSASGSASASPEASASVSGSPEGSFSAPGAPDEGAPAGAAPEEGAPAGGEDAEGAVDPGMLQAEYEKLSPEELEMHFVACKAALESKMGGAEAGAPEGAVGPGAAGGPPPAGVEPGPEMNPAPPMGKAEMPSHKTNGDATKNLGKVGKSEELSKMEGEVKEMKHQLNVALQALDLLSRPLQKAITGTNYVPKTQETKKDFAQLSKSEINEKLKKKVTTKLAKSDRHLINEYCYGNVGVEKIAHLLKDE